MERTWVMRERDSISRRTQSLVKWRIQDQVSWKLCNSHPSGLWFLDTFSFSALRGKSQRDFFSIKTHLSFCLTLSQERQETREQQGEFPVFSSLQEEGRADNLLVTKHTSSGRLTGRIRLRTRAPVSNREKNWK